MDRYWILIGMMGAGKSVIGQKLADRTGRAFRDTDEMLQRRFGATIHTIFQKYGEDAFRAHESSILKSLEPEFGILSTGGGIVIRSENWVEMRRLGVTIFLDVDPETLVSRLGKSKRKRPLLQTEEWPDKLISILEARRPLYEQADLIVKLDDENIEDAVERIAKGLEAWH